MKLVYSQPKMPSRKKQKWYAVRIGRQPGVYSTWKDCQQEVRGFILRTHFLSQTILAQLPPGLQVHGFSGAVFKSFNSKQQAQEFLQHGSRTSAAMPQTTAMSRSDAAPRQGSAAATSAGGSKRSREASARGAAPGAGAFKRAASSTGSPSCVWKAYFDGGSRGNPGVGGAGACVVVGGVEVASAVQSCRYGATNNEAECIGAALAVRLLSALLAGVLTGQVPLARPSRIQIMGDSKLIVNQVQGLWQVRAQNLVKPVAELRSLTESLHAVSRQLGSSGASIVQWEHVRREHNQRADALSNVAMNASSRRFDSSYISTLMFPGASCPALLDVCSGNAGVRWTTNCAAAHDELHWGGAQDAKPAASAVDSGSRGCMTFDPPPEHWGTPHTDSCIENKVLYTQDGNEYTTQDVIDDMFSWEDGTMQVCATLRCIWLG